MLLGRRFTERALELAWEKRLPVGLHPSAGQGGRRGRGLLRIGAQRLGTTFAEDHRGFLDPWGDRPADVQRHHGQLREHHSGKESFHHSGYPELGILAGTAMVGAQIPESVGVAWAMKMKKTDDVMVCFFGGRRGCSRRFPRRAQSRRVAEGAGRIRLREQPLFPDGPRNRGAADR